MFLLLQTITEKFGKNQFHLYTNVTFFLNSTVLYTAQTTKFSIKKTADLVTFSEEILNGKLCSSKNNKNKHFLFLLQKDLPPTKNFRRIFNKITVKISYWCRKVFKIRI